MPRPHCEVAGAHEERAAPTDRPFASSGGHRGLASPPEALSLLDRDLVRTVFLSRNAKRCSPAGHKLEPVRGMAQTADGLGAAEADQPETSTSVDESKNLGSCPPTA